MTVRGVKVDDSALLLEFGNFLQVEYCIAPEVGSRGYFLLDSCKNPPKVLKFIKESKISG